MTRRVSDTGVGADAGGREAMDDGGRDTHAGSSAGLLKTMPLGIGHHHRELFPSCIAHDCSGGRTWHRDRWCPVSLVAPSGCSGPSSGT